MNKSRHLPHWVENGPDVSVSLSINFKRVVDAAADAHRVNHALRETGSIPVARQRHWTASSSSGYRAARSLKRLVSR